MEMEERYIEIPQNTIDTVLEPYSEDFRYLESAELYPSDDQDVDLEYPRVIGDFNVSGKGFSNDTEKTFFMDAISTLCYNQLGYAFFAEISSREMLKEEYRMSVEESRRRGADNYVIREERGLRHRKGISPDSFQSEMIVEGHESRARGHIHLFDTHFNFEDGSVVGDVGFFLDFRD